MLDDARLVFTALRQIPQIQTEGLLQLLALVPSERTSSRTQKRRILLHFLHLNLDHLLVTDGDPLKLKFIRRFRTTLQNDLRVLEVHDLGLRQLRHLFLVGLFLSVIHSEVVIGYFVPLNKSLSSVSHTYNDPIKVI